MTKKFIGLSNHLEDTDNDLCHSWEIDSTKSYRWKQNYDYRNCSETKISEIIKLHSMNTSVFQYMVEQMYKNNEICNENERKTE